MDAVNATILKTTIEAIPVLTEENFSTWKTRITALFKLGGLKDQIINGEPELEDDDNTILCAVIIAKLSSTTHKNLVNSANEENTILLWKSILKQFISNEPSNRAQVYNSFANIVFNIASRLPEPFGNPQVDNYGFQGSNYLTDQQARNCTSVQGNGYTNKTVKNYGAPAANHHLPNAPPNQYYPPHTHGAPLATSLQLANQYSTHPNQDSHYVQPAHSHPTDPAYQPFQTPSRPGQLCLCPVTPHGSPGTSSKLFLQT
jgi:hypothetical protein